MGHFEIAACLVTVAEWQWFWRDPRCCDASAPWWQAAGPAALRWLARQPVDAATGRPHPPSALADSGLNNGLQPIVTLTHWQALAYAAWASGLHHAVPPPRGTPAPLLQGHGWRCRVPTEVQWEAGVRGATHTAPPPAGATAGAAGFNHDAARWGRPSPVGAFSLGLTPDGLADTAGNVWEWCSNAASFAQIARGYQTAADQEAAKTAANPGDDFSERAMRGGAFQDTSVNCRLACRYHHTPGSSDVAIGVRLVRLWLPHSEP